jgi:hypothetical protein
MLVVDYYKFAMVRPWENYVCDGQTLRKLCLRLAKATGNQFIGMIQRNYCYLLYY